MLPEQLYDTSSQTMIRNTTFPSCTGTVATHALVFMICICSRWKQIVSYYFTPDSYDGPSLKPIILRIIKMVHEIGLYISSIISDMGPINMALWKAFDIYVNRNSTCKFCCTYPED